MLILSKKELNQEIVFPRLGVRIEVVKSGGSTVCLGIDAPHDGAILRGELDMDHYQKSGEREVPQNSHAVRNRLNSLSLCLHVIKKRQDANLPIDEKLLSRAIFDLHTIEEICTCDRVPNPFIDRLQTCKHSPFVLLIYNDMNEAQLLAAFLRHAGIRVAICEDGNAALHLLDCIDRKPGIILLDMMIEGLSGPGTLKALRANPLYDDIKVFAVTGQEDNVSFSNRELNVDRWFQKPIQPEQLATQIQENLAVLA